VAVNPHVAGGVHRRVPARRILEQIASDFEYSKDAPADVDLTTLHGLPMSRRPLTHERVFTEAGFASRYAREQQRVFRWMHPPIVEALRKNGFTRGRILDAGCGPGYHSVGLKLAFPGADVVGVDLSEPLLETARRHLAGSGISEGVAFQSADVLHLPFGEDSFDAVICIFMFHLVEDPVQLCNEVERVLKPEGQLVLIDLRRNRILSLFEKEMRSCFTLSEARKIIGQSNLRATKSKQIPIWWGVMT
jgi:ubiquinone/menaquinone biosynthesis C-methylase UbiE